MNLSLKFLKDKNACSAGIDWYIQHKEPDTVEKTIELLLKDEKFDWCNWLLVRCFNKQQNVKYAIYSARLVLNIFEKQYPEDKRPRLAIEAAEAYLKNPNEETKKAAEAAEASAGAAARAAMAAAWAAEAAWAAWVAWVAGAAGAAAWAAGAAAQAAEAVEAAGAVTYKKIIKYGVRIL